MKRTKSIIIATLAATLGTVSAKAANDTVASVKPAVVKPAAKARKPMIPAREWKMIREVAVNNELSDEETWLLAAIRKHENGRPGLEFGIGGPMDSGHRAHRYQDGTKSFYVQALWAAGTIRKRYTGDLAAFGRRYNPKNPAKWTSSISGIIARLKAENNNKLPGEKPAMRNLTLP